jgi:putative selenate reductase molybdopterin-binding subunit
VLPLSQPVEDEGAQPWEPVHSSLDLLPGSAIAQQLTLARSATLVEARSVAGLNIVGRAERKVDGGKLAIGKSTFVDDIEMRGMLYARVLSSPHAHAIIREIDVSEARTLSGVHAVLTYKDVQRVPYTAAGQAWPERSPRDQYVLDNRVRFVGDRVAVVAAETPEIAEQALKLIAVDYDVLPAVLDPRLAISAQAPSIHPEPESYDIHDSTRNLAAYIQTEVGDVEAGFAQADLVVEGEYLVPQVQQAPLETHTAITYWDENDRLVVRTNAQEPFHVRRILATVIGLPPRRIRVVRPSVGASFGANQDMLIEDLCALLTIATARPVRLEYTRAEEFRSGRARHAQIIRLRTGVKRDGRIVANSMMLLVNAGAYGAHSLTAPNTAGTQTLPLYPCPNQSFEANVVYTNLPPGGSFSGSSVPQGFFALESQMDEIARQLGMDALELRRKNWVKVGDEIQFARNLDAGSAQAKAVVQSSGLAECLRIVEEKLRWKEKRGNGREGRMRRGLGIALAMYNSASIGRGMASASLKLNEDGSFNLLVGATDAGSGSETIIAQIVAEVLGVHIEDIFVHASDTDVTPFAAGADTSAMMLLGAGAAKRAAEQVREQLLAVAGQILKTQPEHLTIQDRVISAPDGQSATVSQIAMHSLYVENQRQIIATASYTGGQSSPSFAAQGVEVEIDTETGVVRVLRVISAVDTGHVINPVLSEGQIEGSVAQALGYSVSEELAYDQRGNLLTTNLNDYRVFNAPDMPALETYMVETDDPAGPFGAKASTEIATASLAPAIANAIADALGVRLRQMPFTPERVLRVLRAQARE